VKYSIIIPTLNESKLLADLLDGFNQAQIKENFDFEIVVSDGGSSDDTVNIARNYTDSVIENKDGLKQNISIGRNLGAENSNGDILIFVNADVNINDPKVFLERIKLFSTRDKFMAMTCNVRVFPEEENVVDFLFLSFYNWYFHLLNVIGIGMGRGECQIIRKKVFFDLGGYNENIPPEKILIFTEESEKLEKYFLIKNLLSLNRRDDIENRDT